MAPTTPQSAQDFPMSKVVSFGMRSVPSDREFYSFRTLTHDVTRMINQPVPYIEYSCVMQRTVPPERCSATVR
jgi:hypothetical protein